MEGGLLTEEPGPTPRVWRVDDEPAACKSPSEKLFQEGHEYRTAPSGHEAFELM